MLDLTAVAPVPSHKSFPYWVVIVIVVGIVMVAAAIVIYIRIRNKKLATELDRRGTYTTL